MPSAMLTLEEYRALFVKLRKRGDVDQALLVANQMSNEYPENAAGYTCLGEAFGVRGEYRKALACYGLSLEKLPDQPMVYRAMGLVASLMGNKNEAFRYYHKALELAPDNSLVVSDVANFLTHSGYLADAKSLLSQAIKKEKKPELLDALLYILLREGDKEAIRKFVHQYRKYLKVHPCELHLASAYVTLGETAKAIRWLKSIKLRNEKPWQVSYYTMLANAYAKHKDYRSAFKAYRSQNEISAGNYQPQILEQDVLSLLHDQVGVLKEPLYEDEQTLQPLFIVGLPRTGTTLAEQVLSTTDEVVVAGELEFINSALLRYMKGESLIDLARWYREKMAFVLQENFQQSGHSKDMGKVKWVVDKLPANYYHLNFISRLFPKAKVIYMVRNPLDTGLSIYKQLFSERHNYATRLEDIAHFIALERKMQTHWRAHPPLPIHFLQYESLVSNFEAETQKLFTFLDLPWSEKVKDFYKSERYAVTASWEQVRNPINTRAIGGYKHYEKELQPLISKLEEYGVDTGYPL